MITFQGDKGRTKCIAHDQIKYLISTPGTNYKQPIIQPTQVMWNWFSTMSVWMQKKTRLKTGIAGERYKPVCSVDRL